MKEVAGTLQGVLQYMEVSQDQLREFSEALLQLVASADSLLQAVCRQTDGSAKCTTSAPAFFHSKLPNFIRSNLKALQILENASLTCVRAGHDSRRLEQLLHEDLALLRHVTDFVSDIANWSGHGDGLTPIDESFSLYPACDIEHEQAFWKSHQEQVRDTDRKTLFFLCMLAESSGMHSYN